jgi:hypothetical protein
MNFRYLSHSILHVPPLFGMMMRPTSESNTATLSWTGTGLMVRDCGNPGYVCEDISDGCEDTQATVSGLNAEQPFGPGVVSSTMEEVGAGSNCAARLFLVLRDEKWSVSRLGSISSEVKQAIVSVGGSKMLLMGVLALLQHGLFMLDKS